MKRIQLLLIFGVFVLPGLLLAQKNNANDILGIWFNEEKDAKVEIYEDNGLYFGKVVWLEEPIDPDTGKPKLDDENDDETLRQRPIMGMLLMTAFQFDGEDEWEDGEIYDPKSGNTYSCYIRFEDENTLKVRGFIGISWIGRTTYWTKTTL
jgi:uncharacterized protein (DUF2147 family)